MNVRHSVLGALFMSALAPSSSNSAMAADQIPALVLIPGIMQHGAIASVGEVPQAFIAEKGMKVEQGSKKLFKSAKGPFTVGLYETVAKAPVTLIYEDPYPQDEMITIVAGSMTMMPTKGKSATMNAGDTLVIPAGWTGRIRVSAKLRLIHAEFAPGADR